MIPFSGSGLIATDLRVAMLRSALEAQGLLLDADAIEHADFSAASGHAAVERLRARCPDVTAIVAGNDTIAVGVPDALGAAGIAIPRDVSVIGFDDLPMDRFLNPPLRTIRTDGVDIGRKAAELLFRRLRGEAIGDVRLRSPTEFVVRGSTCPAPSRR